MELTTKINCQGNGRVCLSMSSHPDWMPFQKMPTKQTQTIGFSTELIGELYSRSYSRDQTTQTISTFFTLKLSEFVHPAKSKSEWRSCKHFGWDLSSPTSSHLKVLLPTLKKPLAPHSRGTSRSDLLQSDCLSARLSMPLPPLSKRGAPRATRLTFGWQKVSKMNPNFHDSM